MAVHLGEEIGFVIPLQLRHGLEFHGEIASIQGLGMKGCLFVFPVILAFQTPRKIHGNEPPDHVATDTNDRTQERLEEFQAEPRAGSKF